MRIYLRYVLFQTLKIFFIAMLATTVCLVFFFVVEASVKRGVPFGLATRLAPFLLPDVLAKTLPMAALASVTFAFSRMAGNNEIIALKAMGIAPWKVMVPVWIFMFGVSVASVWLNDLSVSWSRQKMSLVLLRGLESTILTKLRAENRFATPNGKYVVETSGVTDDGVLLAPTFSGGGGEFGGVAESARLEIDVESATPTVKVVLTNAEIYSPGGSAILPRQFNLPIPLNEVFHSDYRVDPSSRKAKAALDEVRAERERNRRGFATSAIFAFLRGDLDETSKPDWRSRRRAEEEFDWRTNRYRLAGPRAWASGFACFFFAWVGAPFAVWFNKADYASAFFACFLPVLVAYYPLFMFGMEGAKNGVVHPDCAWLGNVALAFAGAYFLKKIH